MKLILGSTNEAKIEALKTAAERFYDDFQVSSMEVEAPEQPMSAEEARKGAKSRARQAYSSSGSLGVGIEGYVEDFDGKMFLSVWSAVFDGEEHYEGGGGRSRLPEKIAEMLEKKELGDAIMELMGEDLREGKGAVSLLTEGEIDRPDFTERSLIHAFGTMENRWN